MTPIVSQRPQGRQIEVEFDISAGSSGEREAFENIGAGDLLRDEETGHVYIIARASIPDSGRLALLLQALTGLRTFDYGQNYETSARLEHDRGILTVETTRRFYPAARLARALSHPRATRLALRDPTFSSEPVAAVFLREGDILPGLSGAKGEVPLPIGRVASHDDQDGTIEFTSPLAIALDGPCPLFVRQLTGS
ncbi:hypothetical protein N7E02_23320 [Aliirhizobium terrae]|uniref:hypothetical protein n=1 Tax=Terrirhizobium terrae TaxID=2926709 RepID=UPI002577E1D3|nr:hypothetical protein [Rhizobium sp. CC-CFT758]WJH39664.1 hypothetical protein N7E02_23320 [Rhizobium sp. CC-CFT758]